MKHRFLTAALAALPSVLPSEFAQSAPLIVVEDRGGVSALPYYETLDLQPRSGEGQPRAQRPAPPQHVGEADMLPVRSARLSPGNVSAQVVETPGLTPFFIVGDDPRSRTWLRLRAPALRDLHAVGLVVNVESVEALAALRGVAPGLVLVPASGDDLAERLGLHHYPALITATGIEQ